MSRVCERHTVLFVDGSPLLLVDIKRDHFGKICRGRVVNGGWDLTIKNNILFCDEQPQGKFSTIEEINVSSRSSDYNLIILAAKRKKNT